MRSLWRSWTVEERRLVQQLSPTIEDGPDVSDLGDDGNKPDKLDGVYEPGSSEGQAWPGDLEAFVLRRAS
jgi:hypothetical protein